MSDRNAVLTTLNGQVVEWRVFEDHEQAQDHYTAGVGKLREMIQHTSEDARWEIMLCDVSQYALSKPGGETPAVEEVDEDVDWYSRYLTIMANQARRIRGARPHLGIHVWQRLRGGVADILPEADDAEKSQSADDRRSTSGF